MRPIDADAVCDILQSARVVLRLLGADRVMLDRIDGVVALLSDDSLIPTLDVRPISHSEWIVQEGGWHCRECGEIVTGDETAYCPRCGAVMDDDKQQQTEPLSFRSVVDNLLFALRLQREEDAHAHDDHP